MARYSEWAPATSRNARILSKAYGFPNPKEMANSLPTNALVADFGSGKSNLGRVITDSRNDVHWLNIDIRTGLFNFAQRQQRKSGPGLQYIQASVLQPPIALGSLDRVYSSWLLPHLVLESHDLALKAVHAMASLLKEDGEMKVSAMKGYEMTAADYYAAPEIIAHAVVEASTPGWIGATILKSNNFIRYASGLSMLP